jgi:uncharacterized protein
MKRLLFLLFGSVFGFLLSRAGATTYDFYAGLFLFRNFQLLYVILGAAVTGFVGLGILRLLKARDLLEKQPLGFSGKPFKKGLISGSLIFGLGWGLAGACPGTALAMLGEGKLGAGVTLLGIFLGVYLHGVHASRTPDL